jgi:ketosteroid isomerase-like protein
VPRLGVGAGRAVLQQGFDFSASSAVSFLLASNALVEWRFRATEMISITTPGDEIRPLAGAKGADYSGRGKR